jgi:hypothetical protein
MEPEGLLQHLEEPATDPYPDPGEWSLPSPPLWCFFRIHFNIIPAPTPRSLFRFSNKNFINIYYLFDTYKLLLFGEEYKL